MIFCENKEILEEKAPEIKIKKDTVVYKTFNTKNEFVKSYIIPTVKYPTNSNKIRVFHEFNTSELFDQAIIDLFDSLTFDFGHCYSNADKLYNELKKAGYNAKIYAGWLIRQLDTPVHHCWVVYDDRYVLDPSNTLCSLYRYIEERCPDMNSLTEQEQREVFCNYIEESKHMKNSEKCGYIGAAVTHVYVGCEVSNTEQAKELYNDLMKKYPDHEIESNGDAAGRNQTQLMLEKRGLI